MKLGFSTYCFEKELREQTMTLPDILIWAKDHDCEHVELVPYGYSLIDNPELANQAKDTAAALGLTLSNYSLPANFAQPDEDSFEREIRRLMGHIDLLHRMGIPSMRHDVVAFTIPREEASIAHFLRCLPQIAEGSRRVADYAARFGIVTNIENHGWGVQHSDRVQQILQAVDRPNFKCVLDIGNFLCVDETPLVGVGKNLPYASLVHLKDFYIRPSGENPGDGRWFRTVGGNYLRGAIFGHGDLPVRGILSRIKESGYDGYVTLEFEGMEDNRQAVEIGLANIRRLWDEV